MSGVCEGFVVNRLLGKRSREGFFMLEEGATPAQIDKVLTGFGFPMGPYALSDLAGIDLQYAARQVRMAGLTEREKRADFVDQLYALGRYGQKTGAGWYDYQAGKRDAIPSAVVEQMVAQHRQAMGITPRAIGDEEIVHRLVYALVNEAAHILEEGIASKASDIDMVYLTGYGFPVWRGGPLCYADQQGLFNVVQAMKRFAANPNDDAAFWQPAPLLARLAAEGRTFT
jgi:3-hydroxyacyl-CoA dehydrogenase